jgi:hypothetical protein
MSKFNSSVQTRCTIESAARSESDGWSLIQLKALTARLARHQPATTTAATPWWHRIGREACWAATIASAEFRATRIRRQLPTVGGAR